MPELPDVEHMKRRIMPARGATIVGIRVFDRGFAHLRNRKRIVAATISAIQRRGKFILLELSSGYVVVMHMGMTGDLALIKTSSSLQPYTKCAFELSNAKTLIYTCTRKLGMCTALPRNRLVNIPLLAELGPEPLDMTFTEDDFLTLLKRSRGRIKSFLMNQRRIAGLGNLCADEILFQARVHPNTPIDRLSPRRLKDLYRTMRTVLKRLVDGFDREQGMKAPFINKYREEGTPCPRCSSRIKRIVVDGRGTFFCPHCQRKV